MMNPPTENLIRQFHSSADELRGADVDGDGNTLFGHFAVFNAWTEINSMWEGRFLERVAPGAFARTIAERGDRIRVLYDHGHDPQIGNKPLGKPSVLKEDKRGAYYEVDLFDTQYVRELRPALEAGQMGASFRFRVAGEEWAEPATATKRNPAKLPERTITDVDLYEFGPVTFPAYAEATAGVRSGTDDFLRWLDEPAFVAQLAERMSPHALAQLIEAAGHVPAEKTPAEADHVPTPNPQDPRWLRFVAHLSSHKEVAA